MRFSVISALSAVSALFLPACGHKGPPLPPLIKTPAALADLTAARRGADVDLQFTVPAANTDGTRPANLERVDVYAYTGANALPDDQLLKAATKVGAVDVKAPRDPDLTTDPADEPDELEALEGAGVDQGAAATLKEALTPGAPTPIAAPAKNVKHRSLDTTEPPGPLLWPQKPAVRTYLAVPFGKHGRRGPLSGRVGVPLLPAPAPPSRASIAYTETEITVTWPPPATVTAAPSESGLLPAKPIGWSRPRIGYHVYDGDTRVTKTPVEEPKYVDTRMTWGAERCYTVRTVETVDDLSVESDATPKTCQRLVDTFAPAAPKNLQTVPGEGSISLIWDANEEKDLDGYIVLRGEGDAQTLTRITPAPIKETTFKDTVRPGVRYVYALQAVDKAGNVSPMSDRKEDIAR